MTYLPPVNGGRINATITGNTVGVGALVSSGTMSLAGGNNITLSQAGNAITISGAAAGAQGTNTIGMSNLGNTVGTSGVISGTAVRMLFAGGNNITLSQSIDASSATITISAQSQSVQTQSNIQAIYDGANSISTGTIRFSNSNGIGFGINGQTLTASHNGITSQTNQTVGLFALGNTTQNSSTTRDARSLSFNGLGAATVGYSNGSIQISAPVQTVQTQNLHNVTLSGNTAGAMAHISSGTLTLAGGNNITLSQNGNAVTISGGAGGAAGTNTLGISNLGNSAGTSGVITGSNLQLAFAGGNNITLSQSINGSSATITVSGTNQSIQTQNLHNISLSGNTAGAMAHISSGTMTLAGGNNVTLSQAGNAVTVSAANQTVQTQNLHNVTLSGNTAGAMAHISSGTLTLAGGNNITLSQAGNAITISGAAGGGGGGIVLANSQTTFTSGTVNLLEGGGAITIASSAGGQSYKVSVPATSSLSATGNFSISTNGSTISMGVPNMTLDYYQNMDRGNSAILGTYASLMLQRLNQENAKFAGDITANTILFNFSGNVSTSQSSSHTITFNVGIYSDNRTALSLINSASSSWGFAAATNNTTAYNGVRWLSFVSSQWSSLPVFHQDGEYVFGLIVRTANFGPALSLIGQNYMLSNARSGTLGISQVANASLANGNYWNAILNTTVLPTGITSNQVSRSGATAYFMPHMILNNRYSGTF